MRIMISFFFFFFAELSTNTYFISYFISSISGERDPRCLILVFRLFCILCKYFSSGEWVLMIDSFSEVNINSIEQNRYHQLYNTLCWMVSWDETVLTSSISFSFYSCLMSSISGDFPRKLFDLHASDLFDVVACYYPIEFNHVSKISVLKKTVGL